MPWLEDLKFPRGYQMGTHNLIFSYILKRKNGMTIEECYVKMGANYQDVIKRLPSAKMIEKFALKFKDDTSFQELETAS